ncbi:DUF5937 family protein [Streptomyces sp. Ru87]|uniref:ArsR/SmtB family transcription factor n=1 Tax=Streptomyces sp. Ru87 TaxID=2044307 RepID=UPI000BF64974|nr:DUF5937 family protein [Streptomyces sp. Ru87]PGH48259.1 transcriptional regulator [Streptomyces sp. Ru87]
MPFHMRFGADDLLRCRFAVSPLWETQEAVRTLRRPDRQSHHLPWLRRIRDAAAGLDLAPLWLLMPARGHTPDFLAPPPGHPCPRIDEELGRVRSADPARAREDLALSLAATPGAAASARGRAMLDDPARAVKELADLLELAWRALVEPDWPRLRALLEADVAFHTRRLAEGGLERLFTELHPRLSWADSVLTIHHHGRHSRDLGGSGLLLMPSVFCWPDVVGGFEEPWQPTLVYPARGIGGLWTDPAGRMPDALARLLGRGRAAVLAALEEPATTTGLAHRLGLAPSSVSAHLSALRDAGLLTARRQGHQVLYERTPLGIALAAG